MKKIIFLFSILLLGLTSCSKNTMVIIEDTTDAVDYYDISIGLGETVNMCIYKFYTNEKIQKLYEKKKLTYRDDFYYVNELNDEDYYIEWTGDITFAVTCQNAFEGTKKIDHLTFEKEGYRFTLPISIELTFNPVYDTAFFTLFDDYYSLEGGKYESHLTFTGSRLGYSSDDVIQLKNIELNAENLVLNEVKIVKRESSLLSLAPSDFEYFTYPLVLETKKMVIDFMFTFSEKNHVSSIGEDMIITLEINGDTHKVLLHCLFSN